MPTALNNRSKTRTEGITYGGASNPLRSALFGQMTCTLRLSQDGNDIVHESTSRDIDEGIIEHIWCGEFEEDLARV